MSHPHHRSQKRKNPDPMTRAIQQYKWTTIYVCTILILALLVHIVQTQRW